MAIENIESGWRASRNHVPCWVSDDRAFATAMPIEPERFTALVIGQLLYGVPGARELANEIASTLANDIAGADRVHFFHDARTLPADADCTAIAYLLLLRTGHDVGVHAHRALDLIAATTCNGIVTTYFDRTGERANIVDAVVCANVVRLAAALGRLDDVAPTQRYLQEHVQSGAHLDGTRYYPSPDCLLYSLALNEPFDGLRDAVAARIGATDHTLDLAQRVLAGHRLGLDVRRERARLTERSWDAEGWFCYGRSRRWFGSRALTTAFALAALECR